ncbi:Fanconi anemia complementation group I isoform X2 [Haemaphysalis longicornis]
MAKRESTKRLTDEDIVAKVDKYVASENLKPVYNFLLSNAARGGSEVSAVAKKVIGELPDNDFGRESHREMFTTILAILKKFDLSPEISSSLLSILTSEMIKLAVNTRADIIYDLLDSLKDGADPLERRWLDVLPDLLMSIGQGDTVVARGDKLSGAQFKTLIVNNLCSCPWEPKWAMPLARILREIPLDASEVQLAVPKMIRLLPNLELAEVPPLIYQLLLLHNQGCTDTLLEAVMKFFYDQEAQIRGSGAEAQRLRERFEQTEATAVLHVVFASRLNFGVTRVFIKMLKARQTSVDVVFSPFALTLALALAKTRPFTEQVLDVLKAAATFGVRSQAKHREHMWIREMIPTPKDVKLLVVDMIRHSKCGWEESSERLVELGFLLMEVFNPRLGRTGHSTAHDCCRLGQAIILETFRANKDTCGSIINLVVDRFLSRPSAPSEHYYELLGDMIVSCPQLLVQCQTRIQKLLEYLPHLPCHSTVQLLRATSPLIRASPALQDWLVVMLRKLMFYRELECRKVAVSGILVLLRNLRLLAEGGHHGDFSLSQLCVQVAGEPSGPGSHRSLCAELLGLLNKSLTQQGALRQLLYQGHLILGCHRCLMVAKKHGRASTEHGPEDASSSAQLQRLLGSLTDAMADADLGVFSLDKMSDVGASVVGQKNRLLATELRSVCEALIEHSLSWGGWSASSAEVSLKLFSLLYSAEQLLQATTAAAKKEGQAANPAGKGRGKAGGRATSKQAPRKPPLPSLLSAPFLATLLENLFCSPSEYSGLSGLLEDATFMQYVVNAARSELARAQDAGTFEDLYRDRLLRSHFRIARVFLEVCKQRSKDRDDTVASVCIESLGGFVGSVARHHVGQMPLLLATMMGAEGSSEPMAELLKSHFAVYKALVNDLLSQGGDGSGGRLRELVPLLAVCGTLFQFIEPGSLLFAELQDWARDICREQSIADPAIARSLLSFYLTVNHQVHDCLKSFASVAASLHCCLGDVDDEVELSRSKKFNLVNAKTAASLVPVLLENLQRVQENVDWLLALVRSKVALEASSKEEGAADSPPSASRPAQEMGVCRQLGYLAAIFVQLVQSRLPSGRCSESVVKQLTRFYNSLSALSKLYLFLYSSKLGSLCSKYEYVIKAVATQLTPSVYALITFLQNAESEKEPVYKKPRRDEAQKAAVSREVTTIPSLIFAIEQHERLLIQLAKRSKVNLMEHVKISTARDFRICSDKVQENLEVLAEAPDDDNLDSDGDGSLASSNGVPSAQPTASAKPKPKNKRLRMARGTKK